MKRKALPIMLLILTMITASISPVFAKEATTVTIIHTNDTHGNVADDGKAVIGFAKLATYVAEAKTKENVIVLDAGDMFQGLPFANVDEGHSIVPIVNEVGYDAMVPGNHEFDFGSENFLEIVEKINFPVLATNVLKNGEKPFLNYLVKEIAGIKVGVFGLSTPETAFKTHPNNVKGYTFEDIVASSKAAVKALKETEKVDVVVAITHLGLDEGDYTSDIVAKEVAGIDVIIDGHSHTELPEGRLVGNTLIASTKTALNNIGRVEITVENGKVVNKTATLLDYNDLKEVTPKASIVAEIEKINAAQDEKLKEVIGTTKVDLVGEREVVRTGESNLGQLAADAMLNVSGAQIAMTNGGGIRASIKAGEITKKDMVTVFPFGNTIMVKELSGADVLAMLEYGVNEYPNTKGAFPHTAGMTFTLNGYAPVGSRISDVKVAGVPLDVNKTYTVATNDFVAAGGDGYEMFKAYPIKAEYNTLMDTLLDYIKGVGEVEGKLEARMTLNLDAKLREYAESLDFKVVYEAKTKGITLTKEDVVIQLQLGNATYSAKDSDSNLEGTLENAPTLQGGATTMSVKELNSIIAALAA